MMLRTFLLTALLLVRTVHALQNFTGIGTVQCPSNIEGEAAACEPSYKNPGGFFACVLDCPEAASFVVASLMDTEATYLPCECTQAINCPDSCTFTAGAVAAGGLDGIFNTTLVDGNIFNTTTIATVSYQGAGRLTCPYDDYFAAPCIPIGEDCDGPGFFTCVATALSTLNVTDTTIGLDVRCDCVTLTDCSTACTFEPMMMPSFTANATGPGTLLCPSIDYIINPCTINVTRDDCDCEPSEFFRDTLVEFAVSLPCDCAVATNCPESCEFTTEVITDELAVHDFTGPGVVTCSTEDYMTVGSCRVSFFNIFDCLQEGDECLSASLMNPGDIVNFTDTEVSIPLPCSCMALSGCPDSCTFTSSSSSNNEAAMPSAPTAATPRPATTPTAAPAAAPSLSTTAATPIVATPTLVPKNNSTVATPTAPTAQPPTAGSAPIGQPPIVGDQLGSDSGSTLRIAAGAFWTTLIAVLLTVV